MGERYCGNCRYIGAENGETLRLSDGEDHPFHICENEKSIFKSCLTTATGCSNYESKPKEDMDEGN